MKAVVFVLAVLLFVPMHGQKLVKKGLVGPQTEYIQIDTDHCYSVQLGASTSNEVQVVATIEGEYANNLLISMENEGATMRISAGFQPNFTKPNDKLSAHKVISIALQVTVPDYKNVKVFGKNSALQISGNYQDLNITLSDGRCVLNRVTESVTVTTQKGDIWVEADNGFVSAESAYGKVDSHSIPHGNNRYVLKTVEGNIHLRKTK